MRSSRVMVRVVVGDLHQRGEGFTDSYQEQ